MGETLSFSLSRSMGASVSLSELAQLNPAVFLVEFWLTLPLSFHPGSLITPCFMPE